MIGLGNIVVLGSVLVIASIRMSLVLIRLLVKQVPAFFVRRLSLIITIQFQISQTYTGQTLSQVLLLSRGLARFGRFSLACF